MSRLKIVNKGDIEGPIVYMTEEEFQEALKEDLEAATKRIEERRLRMDEIVERCKRREKKRLKKMELEGKIETERRDCMRRAKKNKWSQFRSLIATEWFINTIIRLEKGMKKLARMEKKRSRLIKKMWLEDQKNKPILQIAHQIKVVENIPGWARVVPIVSECHPFPLEAPLKGGSQDGVVEINLETKSSSKQILHEFLQKKGEKLPDYKSYPVNVSGIIKFGCLCSLIIKKESYLFKVKANYMRIRDAEHAVADEAYKKVVLLYLDDDKDYEEMVNYKGRLQELCVKKGWGYPIYNVEEENGNFRCSVLLQGSEFFGVGKRKKIAENIAAKNCWLSLGKRLDEDNDLEINYKSKLFTYCQKRKMPNPIYTYESEGPNHNLMWRSRCSVGQISGLSSWCQNKKKSENESSMKVCEQLDNDLNVPSSEVLDIISKDTVSKFLSQISIIEKQKDDGEGSDLLDEIIMNFTDSKEIFDSIGFTNVEKEDDSGESEVEDSDSYKSESEDIGDEILFDPKDPWV